MEKKAPHSVCRTSLGVFSVLFFFLGVGTASAATLSLSPASGSFTVGAIVPVQILLNTLNDQVVGVDIRNLNFPPSLLSVEDENTGTAGVQITPGTLFPSTAINSVDNGTGDIVFSQVGLGSTYTSGGSTALFATVRFRVLAAGTASIFFDATGIDNTDVITSLGTDVLTSATGGTFTFTGTPPPAAVCGNGVKIGRAHV